MDLIFDFDRCQGISNAHFDGLDGSEAVTSVKEALNLMKIWKPSIVFSEAVHDGAYNRIPDAEYKRMLDTVKYISTLWHHADDPANTSPQYEMNPLVLLANALEALSQLNAQFQMPFEAES